MEYGRYRIVGPLGQGGMATVHLAEDPLLQRFVAIKVIQAHLLGNQRLLERFLVEAKTVAALRHINVIEIFDFGVQNNQPYLVMEYVDGQNLQFVCSLLQGKPMPAEIVAAIAVQTADGLMSAERHGVVHRDIKPENLMFTSEGVLKIADFGIAHIATDQSRTQTGAIVGSPNYMSPEQIEGAKPTPKSDLFSLGAVLYYCLTGRTPFTGPNIPVTMRNICEMVPTPIENFNPQIDPVIVQCVTSLLNKKVENRPENARVLSLQLRNWLAQKGIVDPSELVRSYIHSVMPSSAVTSVAKPDSSLVKNVGEILSLPLQVSEKSSPVKKPEPQKEIAFSGSSSEVKDRTKSSKMPLIFGLFFFVVLFLGIFYWNSFKRGQKDLDSSEQSFTGQELRSSRDGSPDSVQNISTDTFEIEKINDLEVGTKKVHPFAKPPPKTDLRATPKAEISNNNRPKIEEDSDEPIDGLDEVKANNGRGLIRIKTVPPFAALVLDGKSQGETPMSNFVEVPEGPCRIEIVHRLHPPFDTTIQVTAGFKKEFKFKLDR